MNGISRPAELAPTTLTMAEARKDRAFWPGLLLGIAATSIVVGLLWDISWHISIGRDTFWTPAHMAIYLGGVLAGCVGGWLALKYTLFPRPEEQESAVNLFGLRAPLGAWVAIWGALAMVTSAPFDDWWHSAYGLDVKIISPPHAVLGLGMFAISVSAVLLVLARQNRLSTGVASELGAGGGLFVYAGGIFLTMGSVFISEYTFPNLQHTALFFKVSAVMIVFRLVALGRAARLSWPATRVAAVYMGLMCLMIWILPLFPAQPKLAPIYNPITHMVPPAFPLLLIFPAAGMDLVLRKLGNDLGWFRKLLVAVALGAVFVAIFMLVQWFFAEFMLSPKADNWFFAGSRFYGYGSGTGKWRNRFWHVEPGRPDADILKVSSVLITWLLASAGAWIGLLWGNWMRKVQR
jgi:hypothetical protein